MARAPRLVNAHCRLGLVSLSHTHEWRDDHWSSIPVSRLVVIFPTPMSGAQHPCRQCIDGNTTMCHPYTKYGGTPLLGIGRGIGEFLPPSLNVSVWKVLIWFIQYPGKGCTSQLGLFFCLFLFGLCRLFHNHNCFQIGLVGFGILRCVWVLLVVVRLLVLCCSFVN